jgi:hypothetical protein
LPGQAGTNPNFPAFITPKGTAGPQFSAEPFALGDGHTILYPFGMKKGNLLRIRE